MRTSNSFVGWLLRSREMTAICNKKWRNGVSRWMGEKGVQLFVSLAVT